MGRNPPIGSIFFVAGISGCCRAHRPDARQPELSPARDVSTGMPPINGSLSLLASSHSPHPSASLAVGLPARCCWSGGWSGLPRSPDRIDSPFRLHLSPDSRCGTATHTSTVLTDCVAVLAEANNCRRPLTRHEGSSDDSRVLAMRVGSLASGHPCSSDTQPLPLPDSASLTRRDIVDRASHPGVGPRRMPI